MKPYQDPIKISRKDGPTKSRIARWHCRLIRGCNCLTHPYDHQFLITLIAFRLPGEASSDYFVGLTKTTLIECLKMMGTSAHWGPLERSPQPYSSSTHRNRNTSPSVGRSGTAYSQVYSRSTRESELTPNMPSAKKMTTARYMNGLVDIFSTTRVQLLWMELKRSTACVTRIAEPTLVLKGSLG